MAHLVRVVKVKLLPSDEQARTLAATLRACNEGANLASRVAFERRVRPKVDLQRVVYGEVKQRVVGAQAAVRVIGKVADAYKAQRSNLRAGRYGKPGSQQRAKAELRPIVFRPDAAQPFDARNLSWRLADRVVSIWTLQGRILVPITGRDADLDLLARHRIGETDLVMRDGMVFLHATIAVPGPAITEPCGFIGVDLGIVKIASTAREDGTPVRDWSGGAVTSRRKRNARLRRRLQAKGTASARRLLVKRSGKESRFVADVNHQISKSIVAEAQRTGAGIAVENLTGIRDRVRLRKPQRAAMHTWAFAVLGQFLRYKAEAAGVAFVQVDAAYTSQTCSGCGVIDKKSRESQADWVCRTCGVSLNADTNAAVNIARRGVDGWAEVNRPDAARPHAASVGSEQQAPPVRAGSLTRNERSSRVPA